MLTIPKSCANVSARLTLVLTVMSAYAASQTLQSAMEHAMAGRSGGAVVISVKTSKVLAIYHPDVVARRLAKPGSAIKPFVELELLRSKKVSAETEWACRRQVRVGKHDLDCRHVRTVEAMNAERALAYSCNSYFTEMAARLDPVELQAGLEQAGFGAPSYILNGAATGYVRLANNREMLQLEAVGEDGIESTPLEVAAAYRLLAVQYASQENAVRTVIAGMRGAVGYGTAQGAQVKDLHVAGKTGTSSASEGGWTHAWFAGFAPAENPEIVVVVFLERGHGSEAAEIAGQVLSAWARGRK